MNTEISVASKKENLTQPAKVDSKNLKNVYFLPYHFSEIVVLVDNQSNKTYTPVRQSRSPLRITPI